jgi:(p)ppGpp synthase/HD superfamily hydrolase
MKQESRGSEAGASRLARAFALAEELHRGQRRKGGGPPYLSHLMAVAALVQEDGGDEEEVMAALLHDGPEDRGGRATLERIRREVGERVATIVEGCTETFEEEKPAWRPRKEAYVARLRTASASVRRVAAADKVHNLESLLSDIRKRGARAFARFRSSGRAEQAWFYEACASLLRASDTPLARRARRLARRLRCAVRRLDRAEAAGRRRRG